MLSLEHVALKKRTQPDITDDDFTLRMFFSSTFYFFYFDLQSYGCKRPFRVYSLVKDPLNGDQIHVLGHWRWPRPGELTCFFVEIRE